MMHLDMIATLVLPVRDNQGKDMLLAIRAAEADLILHFEGFTLTAATGVDIIKIASHAGAVRREHVNEYKVACVSSDESLEALRNIARRFRIAANQDSVYLSCLRLVSTEFIV